MEKTLCAIVIGITGTIGCISPKNTEMYLGTYPIYPTGLMEDEKEQIQYVEIQRQMGEWQDYTPVGLLNDSLEYDSAPTTIFTMRFFR